MPHFYVYIGLCNLNANGHKQHLYNGFSCIYRSDISQSLLGPKLFQITNRSSFRLQCSIINCLGFFTPRRGTLDFFRRSQTNFDGINVIGWSFVIISGIKMVLLSLVKSLLLSSKSMSSESSSTLRQIHHFQVPVVCSQAHSRHHSKQGHRLPEVMTQTFIAVLS